MAKYTSLAVSSREPKPDDDDFNVLPVIYIKDIKEFEEMWMIY